MALKSEPNSLASREFGRSLVLGRLLSQPQQAHSL
jgi:hypothetical protein